jgi:hypothetical protein
MLIHTATTARPDMDTSVIYTVPGAIMLDSKARPPPTMLIRSAFSGTPRLVNWANHGEIVFLSASDHSIREEAYRPELAAERIAVRIYQAVHPLELAQYPSDLLLRLLRASPSNDFL